MLSQGKGSWGAIPPHLGSAWGRKKVHTHWGPTDLEWRVGGKPWCPELKVGGTSRQQEQSKQASYSSSLSRPGVKNLVQEVYLGGNPRNHRRGWE